MNPKTFAKIAIARTPLGRRLQNRYGSQNRLQESVNLNHPDGLKLNVGCGELHLEGYINIDKYGGCNPDHILAAQDILNEYENKKVSVVQIIHGIGYLSHSEAVKFMDDVFRLLLPGGLFVLETPSIEKISKKIVADGDKLQAETIFPIFATTDSGPTHGSTYQFIWNASLLIDALYKAGFSSVQLEDPKSHSQKIDRDIRVVAQK